MNTRLVLEVARWEFLRFFKLKDVVLGLVTLAAGGAAVWVASALVVRSARPIELRVVGPGAQELVGSEKNPAFKWIVTEQAEAALRKAVRAREADGALWLAADGSARLVALQAPLWLPEVQSRLNDLRRRRALREAMLTSGRDEQAAIEAFAAARLAVETLDTRTRGSGLVAAFAIGVSLLGVLIGNAYLLAGITGEKQLRITEQVVAAIRPQTWIDGKIVGLSALTLANLALYVVPTLGSVVVLRGLGMPVPALPPGATDPAFLAALLLFSGLGFLLWFTFFAAVAATIDDPNTSSRGGWLIAPLIPLGLAFVVIRNPDTVLARLLGLMPFSAPTAMPVRLLLTDVAGWELAVAVVGLLASILALRRAAGRIFELGMLMYGKEPTWPEMRRWLREADPRA